MQPPFLSFLDMAGLYTIMAGVNKKRPGGCGNTPGARTTKERIMATSRIHDHDDTIDAHHSCLGRLEALELLKKAPHGCYRGFVFVGRMIEDEGGEEVEVFEAVPCRRCADNA